MRSPQRAETVIAVRVIPRSSRTRIDGMRGDAFLVRLAAPPVEGAANDALVAFLAEHLDLPRRNIRILSGDKSRDKRVAVTGLDAATIAAKLLDQAVDG
ncbi:MAG: DUF167 domain-containing protein [Acidobacteria bacterium]|nr:MAG: DUF167 domain-containing protein [Acidobacteriota bacterium]